MIAALGARDRTGRRGLVLPRRSDRDLGPRADPGWMLAGPNSLLLTTHSGPRGADVPRGSLSERPGVCRIHPARYPSRPTSRAQISHRREGITEPGDGIRSESGSLKPRNPRNRAKRLCRWLAYHVCRAGSLVRLVLVASIVVPPRAQWEHRVSKCGGRGADLWTQLFSDVSCIALWINSEYFLTRLYSVLHWFHKRLEVNIKNPWENRCFQTVIIFSFGSVDNS